MGCILRKMEMTAKNKLKHVCELLFYCLDLPTQSPLLYNAIKILLRWEQLLRARLETYPNLEESLIQYVPSYADDGVTRGGVTLQRMKVLLDPENTPFRYYFINML